MTKEGQALDGIETVSEILDLLSQSESNDSMASSNGHASMTNNSTTMNPVAMDAVAMNTMSGSGALGLLSPPENLNRSIKDVAEELTLEEVLNIWQSATDRLHETHLTLQKEISRLSDELEEKNRELAKKDRLADLGQMAAHVAHEVRNNLVPMTLYMNLLKRQLCTQSVSSDPSMDKSVQLLGKIETGVESMRSMVSDLLNFTSDRQPSRKAIDAVEFVESLLLEVRPQCSAQSIQITTDIREKTTLYADVDMLKRATRNLLINSVDAMQGGGTLNVCVKSDDRGFSIAVSDTGPGIPSEVVAKLFDPFVTTKDTGTGLGLSIVERIVVAHNGRIAFENLPTAGTCFQLIIPNE